MVAVVIVLRLGLRCLARMSLKLLLDCLELLQPLCNSWYAPSGGVVLDTLSYFGVKTHKGAEGRGTNAVIERIINSVLRGR